MDLYLFRISGQLTDDGEDVLAEGGLEERRLARDFAAEAPRRVQVHAPQQDVRLRRLATLKFEFTAKMLFRNCHSMYLRGSCISYFKAGSRTSKSE